MLVPTVTFDGAPFTLPAFAAATHTISECVALGLRQCAADIALVFAGLAIVAIVAEAGAIELVGADTTLTTLTPLGTVSTIVCRIAMALACLRAVAVVPSAHALTAAI
jgi:hypothetical protein